MPAAFNPVLPERAGYGLLVAQQARHVLGKVGDNDISPGPADGEQAFGHDPFAVDPALSAAAWIMAYSPETCSAMAVNHDS